MAQQEKQGGYLGRSSDIPMLTCGWPTCACRDASMRWSCSSTSPLGRPSQPDRAPQRRHSPLCFVVDDLPAVYEQLRSAGVDTFVSPPVLVDTGINTGGYGGVPARSRRDRGGDLPATEQVGRMSDDRYGGLDRQSLLDLLRRMIEIRLFEDEVQRLFAATWSAGSTHLCQGQEAVVGRRLRGAARGRHDDLHLPRPRRRAGDGRAARPPLRPRSSARPQGLAAARAARCTSPTSRVGALGSFAIVGAHLPIAIGAGLRRAVPATRRRRRCASSATARPTSAPSTRR